MNNKFYNKKFKLMEVGEDFDFDLEKQQREWKLQNAILEKM